MYKKIILFICIILLILSVVHDLEKSYPRNNKNDLQNVQFQVDIQEEHKVIKVTAKPGDTILSLIEEANDGISEINIEILVKEFKRINNSDSITLKAGSTYYVPIYK